LEDISEIAIRVVLHNKSVRKFPAPEGTVAPCRLVNLPSCQINTEIP